MTSRAKEILEDALALPVDERRTLAEQLIKSVPRESAGAVSEAWDAEVLERLEAPAQERRPKTPRFGVEGCCGKGCNGCLMFWNDPAYARARDLLAKKKHGEKLSKQEILEKTGT